jgi:hypothetical protein
VEHIMSRKFLIPLVAAAFLAAPAMLTSTFVSAMAPSLSGSAVAQGASRRKTIDQLNALTTTVKSSKSNTSDRMGGGGTKAGGGVNRMGGGGGKAVRNSIRNR